MVANEPSNGINTNLDSNGAIDESEVFHILGNDRRREIITNIADQSDGVTVSELASEIARREESDADPTKDLYKSVYVSLQQTHLPKLADGDIIRYDSETNVVEPGPRLDQVEVYVTDDSGVALTHPVWPVTVSLAGLAIVIAAVSGVPVVSTMEATVWAVGFLAVIAALGVLTWLR